MASSRKDRHEFRPLLIEIEDAPLNPLGRTVFWIIIATLSFSLLWLCFGRIDVVVTARGKVIPAGEVKTVQSLTTGVVRRILVKAGQLVEKGEILMEIDPSDTEPELASLNADLEQADLEMLRLEAQLSDQPFQVTRGSYDPDQIAVQQRLYNSSRAKLAGQLQAKADEIVAAEQRLAAALETVKQEIFLLEVNRQRLERLTSVRDLVSRDDYEKAATEVAANQSHLVTARHQVAEIQATLDQLRQELKLTEENERNELLGQLAKKRQEYLYLKARVERTDFINARQQIRSPVRGYLAQLQVHTIGAVVTPAERLATVVPADSPLLVKVQVLNKDVGYLHPGMEAAIKVDTFEFQKFGMLGGKLLHVAQDSIEDKAIGQVYEAYVQPQETNLKVAGVNAPITAGMTVTTEFKVGRRRVIEFFVYPLIKYLDEGISVR